MSVHSIEDGHPLYGLMAEFETAERTGGRGAPDQRSRDSGSSTRIRRFRIHELDDAMDLHDNRVSLFTLIGGLIGCCGGFGLASWVEAVALPLNIGGRPLISAPMYIPITFECTILIGGLTAAISMIMHERPAIAVSSGFQRGAVCATASRSKFFLCIESDDPKFDRHADGGFPGEPGAGRDSGSGPMRMIAKSLGVALVGLSLVGCSRLDMQDQPKYRPQRPSDFFADGRSERQPVEGTIARGALNEDTAFYEGKDAAGKDIEAFPIAVDKAFIERGQQRYDIYCAPCHGAIGNGLGMIVRRGFKQPPSYHIDRLREAPVGHFYDVISNGYGAMLNYAQQVQVRDRWAIVAYIRALQYSQNANVNDLPAEARAQSAGDRDGSDPGAGE